MTISSLNLVGSFDRLSDAELRNHLASWCAQAASAPLTEDALDLYYHTISPRSVFVKNLPQDACLLDMGAGEGTLSIYKTWPPISRPDVKFYGTSLDPIAYAANYERVSITNFETTPRPFDSVEFDAIFAAHFIEHLSNPSAFIEWAASSLKPGGRIYLEWPHEFSKRLPPASLFADWGVPAFTTNFFDDKTHIETWGMKDVVDMAGVHGLLPESAGRIVLPYAAEQLRDRSRDTGNKTYGTFAIWCCVGWAQFLILSKKI